MTKSCVSLDPILLLLQTLLIIPSLHLYTYGCPPQMHIGLHRPGVNKGVKGLTPCLF
jgi:hypothetical protein